MSPIITSPFRTCPHLLSTASDFASGWPLTESNPAGRLSIQGERCPP
jgi:hypothetical protein